MGQTGTLPNDQIGAQIYRRIYILIGNNHGGPESIGAALGLTGGILSVPFALLLWAATFVATPKISLALNMLSNILFALTLPLLVVGACCLDALEKKTACPSVATMSRGQSSSACDARPARNDLRRKNLPVGKVALAPSDATAMRAKYYDSTKEIGINRA